MTHEASKTRALWDERVLSLIRGRGIDIGCGSDPIFPDVERFDREQGDANRLSAYISERYDFAFASHVLEHMEDPRAALEEWLSVLKPGGHLIVIVPDEDLYEQGVFPSLFNSDHKHTFTISKARSWSPRSLNVLDLVRDLGGELVSVELQDHGYDRRILRPAPGPYRLVLLTLWRRLARAPFLRRATGLLNHLFIALGAPVDQTALPDCRLAQIQFILRKPTSTPFRSGAL